MPSLQSPRKAFVQSKQYLKDHPVTSKTEDNHTNFDEVEKLHQDSRNKYDRSSRVFRILTAVGASIFIASILFWVFESVS
ncbi:MAG: hypothetical protein ABJ004_07615 [Cyclobacteriaceae bacterium]